MLRRIKEEEEEERMKNIAVTQADKQIEEKEK